MTTTELPPAPPARRAPLRPARRWVLALGLLLTAATLFWGLLWMASLLGRTTQTTSSTLRPDGTVLSVSAPSGAITVTGADVPDVRVTTRLTYGLRRPAVTQLTGPEGVTLDVHCPWWNVLCDSSYDVVVPRGFEVRARSSGGSITVRDVTGSVQANSSGGGITLSDLTGRVSATSSGGSVRLAGVTGPVDLHSSGGGIAAVGLRGDVTAGSSGGSVHLAFDTPPSLVDVSSSGGGIELRLPPAEDGYSVDATASGGGRTVSVPTDPRSVHRVTAHSDGGSVRVLPTTDG